MNEEGNQSKKGLSKRVKIILGAVIVIVVTLIIGLFLLLPPSVNSVYEEAKKIQETNEVDGTEESIDYIMKEYNLNRESGEVESIFFKKMKKDRVVAVITKLTEDVLNGMNQSLKDFETASGGISFEDYNKVAIESVKIKNKDYKSDYCDIEVTIKNDSSIDINYVKIDLYYKDANNNIINSEWTNDSSCIKSGAKQTLVKTTKIGGWETVKAEISELRK